MSSISSCSCSKNILCIPVSASDAAAVNPTRIKTFLTNGLITFFVGSPAFNNVRRSLPRNLPD